MLHNFIIDTLTSARKTQLVDGHLLRSQCGVNDRAKAHKRFKDAMLAVALSAISEIPSRLPILFVRNTNNGTRATATTGNTSSATAFQVANPLENAAQERFVLHSNSSAGSSGSSRNNNNPNNTTNNQFINRPLLCRTPPPVYNSLPSTPPPVYTPRCIEYTNSNERQVRIVRECNSQENASVRDYVQAVESSNLERRQFVELHSAEYAANGSEATASTTQATPTQQANYQQQAQQHQLLQQQHLRRRRRLHLLQQLQPQCFPISSINREDSSSSDSSSSSCSFSDSETEVTTRNESRRRVPIRCVRGVRDAYCPDLLNACSLILHQQPTSDSSIGSFTDTLPALSQSSDYIDIDEFRPQQRGVCNQSNQNRDYGHLAPVSHRLQHSKSTPALNAQRHEIQGSSQHAVHAKRGTENEHSNCAQLDNKGISRNQRKISQEMGQSISLRRPRISLTWVLREQQQQQQQSQQNDTESDPKPEEKISNNLLQTTQNNNNGYANGLELKQEEKQQQAQAQQLQQKRTEVVPTQLEPTKKRYRIKQLPGKCPDPLNGYATTPTAYATATVPQKFFSNQNLLDYREKHRVTPSKELLFVCTPQRLPKSYDNSEALALAKKRNEIRKKLAAKMTTVPTNGTTRAGINAEPNSTVTNAANGVLDNDELKSLKGTYSEPSLIAASEGNHHRRHRHRKRRERTRVQKFGYEISNVDEFLSKCSLASPGNIPVVLSTSSTLYQTRTGGYQVEIPLPLGMVVNAVFKNQSWLYVQTPHAEEGYIGYACCLPLGILPPAARGIGEGSSKPTPCWESNCDIFPRPCGNMTDSEKEIRLRGGTRSDGARTPRGKRTETNREADKVNGNFTPYGEHQVDKLYLRAASQPKLVAKAYAQLKSTKNASIRTTNDEYATIQRQKSKSHMEKHMQQQQQQLQQLQQKQVLKGPFITNGHNGQHLHPKNTPVYTSGTANPVNNTNLNGTVIHGMKKQHGLRQTLVAINTDYTTASITLKKGEIVTLCECRQSKDHRQWFYVKTRDGREGYIPAEVAGHGYL
ncbi:uncharacterized protein LOC119677459 [Teleopsis dalmanni]|uniref:uncharacterized protein LOC119677459 n=1 Tax=Teleopsis dalmanni TaxID=139649 RepID=UPI0018CCCE99|nr:uncharacterized protein LOC119677459 [Teleopsis dalmanni]